jgi:ABC-2 type transport system ATP-binding protein
MTSVLAIESLTKTYRHGSRANDGLTLSAEAGEVYGVLGHNGAGKTTLVNQVVGLLKPDTGSITIHGHDVVADPAYARRVCSVEAQSHVPIDGMTPRQAIGLVGRLRGGTSADVRQRTDLLIEALDIGEWAGTDGARLSGGVKRLVSFCMAAVVPGRVVILDEPTNDVDPVRRRLLWAEVRSLAAHGAAVLLVTHNVVEAERSVHRLGILDHGRMIAEGTPAELKSSVSHDLRLELVLEPDVERPIVPDVLRNVTSNGHRLTATLPADAAGPAAAWAEGLRHEGRVEEFSLAPATLEDVYVEIVDRAGAARTDSVGRPAPVPGEVIDVAAS